MNNSIESRYKAKVHTINDFVTRQINTALAREKTDAKYWQVHNYKVLGTERLCSVLFFSKGRKLPFLLEQKTPFATQNSYKYLIFESISFMVHCKSPKIFPTCSELEQVLKQKPHYYEEK